MSKLEETLEELQKALENVHERRFLLELEADSIFSLSREQRALEHEHYGPCEECERLYDDLLYTKGLLALELEEKSLKGSIRLVRALLEDEEGGSDA